MRASRPIFAAIKARVRGYQAVAAVRAAVGHPGLTLASPATLRFARAAGVTAREAMDILSGRVDSHARPDAILRARQVLRDGAIFARGSLRARVEVAALQGQLRLANSRAYRRALDGHKEAIHWHGFARSAEKLMRARGQRLTAPGAWEQVAARTRAAATLLRQSSDDLLTLSRSLSL